jgi:hypothetical protein
MISVLLLILLILCQGITGLGLISLFNIKGKPALMIALWFLAGIAVFSFVPFLLQLLYVPLTSLAVFSALMLAMLLLNTRYMQNGLLLKQVLRELRFSIRLYEIPFLLVVAAIVLISVWRCFYMPPTSRDLTSGAEVIAEYAVREKTMLNSVFTVNLETTNNQFKPPYITSLQIIYKYAGFYFGQIWLSTIFIAFLVFLYQALVQHLHRILAWALLIVSLAIPEMYAYTFMVLFDYSNAVFFFLSAYFLFDRKAHNIQLSGLFMGIATYVRSETLILACMMALYIVWKRKQLLRNLAWFLLPAFLFYLLSVTIYINLYLPVPYDVKGLVNPELLSPASLLKRFIALNDEIIFHHQGVIYYNYIFFIFLALLGSDLVFSRKLNPAARNWLFAVLVVYLGYPIMGHMLPLLDLHNSTKRGLFKIFPLMLMYMGNSTILIEWSVKLKQWELAPTSPRIS